MLRRVQAGDFPSPRRVDPTIDRALEAVCLKAMATDPRARYDSCRALADDVEQWAADEPVAAWREPWSRTLVRWLTRHRTGVTAAGAALLAALTGLAAVLGVQARANSLLTAKNAQLDAALVREADRFNLAMDAIKLFHGEVSEDLLLKEKKFEGLRRKLLRGAADFYGKLEGLLEGQADPKSRAALAKSYTELADVTTQIGKGNEALALQLKALAVRRELASRPGADAGTTLDLVRGLYTAARAHLSLGNAAKTIALIGEATTLAEGLVAKGQTSDAFRKRLAECLNYTAILLNENRPGIRNPAKAMEYNKRSLAIAEALAAANPNENESNELLSAVVTHRGILLHDQRMWVEAVEAQRRAAAIAKRLADANLKVPKYRDLLGRAYWNLVGKLSSSGKQAEALATAELAVASWQRVVDDNPAISTYQNNLAFGLNGLGYHLAARGDFARALEAHERARPIMQALADADPSVVGYQRNLARSQSEIGWMRQQLGRYAEALPEYRQELETRRRMEAMDPTNNGYRDDIANCETNIATALLAARRSGRGTSGVRSCDRDPAQVDRVRPEEHRPPRRPGREPPAVGPAPARDRRHPRRGRRLARGHRALRGPPGLGPLRRDRRARGRLPHDALDPRRSRRLRRLRRRRPPRGRRGHGTPPSRRLRRLSYHRPSRRALPRPAPRPPRLPRPPDGRGLPGRPVRRPPLTAPIRSVTFVAIGPRPGAPSAQDHGVRQSFQLLNPTSDLSV